MCKVRFISPSDKKPVSAVLIPLAPPPKYPAHPTHIILLPYWPGFPPSPNARAHTTASTLPRTQSASQVEAEG